METDIKHLQNEKASLKYLAAQRILYSKGKSAFGVQIILTVALSVIFSFLKLIPKNQIGFDLNAYIALSSMLIAFGDVLFFNVYVSKCRTNGAKVQELFDCKVFGLPWNSLNSGSKPENDTVEENFNDYTPDLKAPLENWYDINLDGLTHERAVLLCQETNLFYDGKLREHFKIANIWCCVTVFVISLIIGMIVDLKLKDFVVTVLLPVLPVMILTLKIVMENRKSLTSSIELKKQVIQIKTRTEEPTIQELRLIQDRIFCSRKDSAFVPEWYYKWQRQKLESAMKANASSN